MIYAHPQGLVNEERNLSRFGLQKGVYVGEERNLLVCLCTDGNTLEEIGFVPNKTSEGRSYFCFTCINIIVYLFWI